MKTRIILLTFLLIALSSCGIRLQYDKVYPLYKTNTLKNGLWGDWKEQYVFLQSQSYAIRIQYNSEAMYIYIYNKYNHPSEYCMKITINKKTRSTNGYGLYSSYQGSIEVTNRNIIDYWLNDEGVHIGTILCDEDMDKAIQKNGLVGTLNVLYDGIGRGFYFWQRNSYY